MNLLTSDIAGSEDMYKAIQALWQAHKAQEAILVKMYDALREVRDRLATWAYCDDLPRLLNLLNVQLTVLLQDAIDTADGKEN